MRYLYNTLILKLVKHPQVLLFFIFICSANAFSKTPDISYQTPQTHFINKVITSLSPINIGRTAPATIYGEVSYYPGAGSGFSTVTGIDMDAAGNVYAEDWQNNQIKKISPAGVASIFAGIQVVSTITLKPSIITFPIMLNPAIDANNNINPGATSTNNETPIIYTSSNPSVATITANGLIHLIGPGISIITATQNGNANYADATPVTQTLTVIESQYINFPAIANKTTCDTDFPANATSYNTTIPITYSSSNTTVATISAQGIIHIVGLGTTTITANQSGNNLYVAADPQLQVLNVTAPIVPLVTIVPNHTSVCEGSSVTFVANISNVSANLTYQWQVNGVNVGGNSASLTYIPVKSTDIFRCLVTNNASCQALGTSNNYSGIVINSYKTPVIHIISSASAAVCGGTAITFTAQPTVSDAASPSFQWKINGANAGSNSSTFTDDSFSDGDMVTCEATYVGEACLTTSSIISNALEVGIISPANPEPSVTISASSNNVYIGTNLTFTALPANAGNVISYQWKVNGINAGANSQLYHSDRLHNGDILSCVIMSSIACTAPITSDDLIINLLPLPDVKIPNTFTPNNDGFNDSWDIPGLTGYPNCLVTVYNRNGMLLYQSKGYGKSWDGYFNNQPLPVSTYYYVIDLGNRSAKLSGYITILR